jgi:ribosomal protein S18 acetylase RimI-like enzyme
MSDSFQLEPVCRHRGEEALLFLAAGRRRDLQIALRAEALGEMLTRAGFRGHFWQARRGTDLVAAAMVIPSAGRVGMAFHSPAESPGVDAAALSAALRSAADAALADGLAFVQSLMGNRQHADGRAFVGAGFIRLAELAYMRRELSGIVEPPNVPGLDWQSCQPMDPVELGLVILGTYERSLDCPALTGLRSTDDVIESHKASGTWRPDFWWIARMRGASAGCVLVNDSASSPGGMDLVYMGVMTAFRGLGLGRAMVCHACRQARRDGREFMNVVVDTANPYASRIYQAEGFRLRHRRVAYIRRGYSQERE